MKLAREIAKRIVAWVDDREIDVDEVESYIAAKLEPVREVLEQIVNYGHSDDCDGWHDDKQSRIDPRTGRIYRFNSCPIYECDCGGNAGGSNQWALAEAALSLLSEENSNDG